MSACGVRREKAALSTLWGFPVAGWGLHPPAILIALAYAFCVLAPSVALAITDNPASFRCLDALNAINAPSHHEGLSQSHADGTVHHHDHGGVPDRHSGTDSKTDDGSCCGLFGVFCLLYT